jgi:hypothetical protein
VLLLVLLTELHAAIDNLLGIEDLEIIKYVRKRGINDIVAPTIMVAEGATLLDLALISMHKRRSK